MDNLGFTFQDKITGFRGVCTGQVQYISGCNQLLLVPKSEGGKSPDGSWYDVQRCEQVDEAEAPRVILDNGSTPGCDRAAPKR